MPDTRRLGATLAPNGTLANPAYAFTADPDSGLFLNAVGDMRAAVGGIEKIRLTDDGTNGSGYLMGRGIGAIGFQYGGSNVFVYYLGVVTSTVPIYGTNFRFTEAAAPATPAANMVVAYAKADGLMYSKDDAGVETLMSSGPAGGDTDNIEFLSYWGAFG